MAKTEANTWLEEVFKNDADLIFLRKKKGNLESQLKKKKSRIDRGEVSSELREVNASIKKREDELKRDLKPHLAPVPSSIKFDASSQTTQVGCRQF